MTILQSIALILLVGVPAAIMVWCVICRQRQWKSYEKLNRGDYVWYPLYCQENRICYVKGKVLVKSSGTVTAQIDKSTLSCDRLCDKNCCKHGSYRVEKWKNIKF